MSTALPTPAAPVPPRPRRRWVRRGLLAAGLLLLILVLFHRPFGHWAIRHFGGSALAKSGITGEWRTSGSLLNGLVIDDLKLTGNPTSQLRSVTLQHAALDYDLQAWRRTGPGTALQSLVVQNLEVEIDLTIPRPKPAGSRPPGPKRKPTLPAVVLPAVQIENLTLRLRLPNHQLAVRRFSLLLDPAKPGFIEAEELDLPGTPVLRDLKGVTHLTPTTLTLEQTTLWPDTVLERLMVDVAKLASDEAGISLAARQGATHLSVEGRSGGWFTGVTADATVAVDKISQETLAFWGVPSGKAAWQADRAVLKFVGPVLRPDQLALDLSVLGGGFSLPGVKLTDIQLGATMGGGGFTLGQLKAASGSNTAVAKGQATLPASWAGIAQVPGRLDLTFQAPQLAELLPPGAAVTGQAEGKGTVVFANRVLAETTAEITAGGVQVQGIPVESAASRVRLEDGVLKLEEGNVRLNAQNTVAVTGQLALRGTRDFTVNWQADARDLATVPAAVRAGLPWPTAGTVISQGSASGALQQWQAGDWQSLQGKATVDVTGLRIQEAALDSLHLQADAKAGVVQVEDLSVRLDASNRLSAAGELNLTDQGLPLTARVKLELPQVVKASAWSTQFKGPVLLGGAVAVDWQGEGMLEPRQMESRGEVLVRELKLEGFPEILGLSASLTQSGGEVNLPKLKASAGPWRAEGAVFFDGWHLTVPKLEAFLKNERLVDLAARIPLNGVKVRSDSPVSCQLAINQLDAAKLAAALGKTFPVQGLLSANGNFSGTLETLTGSLTAEATRIKPTAAGGPPTEPATVKLTALVKQGNLALEGTATQRPLQTVTLSASLPLDLPALLENPQQAKTLPLSAQVKMPASSLAFLPAWVPALRTVAGTAAMDFTVSGTVGGPVWKGGATVSASEVTFGGRALPTVKDVKIRLRADEKRLAVDEASVMLAGGRLRVTGGAGIDNFKDPALDFQLTADEVLVVRDENLSLRANAALTCRGRLSAAEVKGQVDLVRGRVFKEIEFLPLSLPNDLPQPPPPTTLGKQGAPALAPPFDRWNFDIAIKTRDPIRLMGNVAKGNAVADLRLSGPGARPELTGTVKLEEMWLKLPFSRLNITEGVVSFSREQPFDPQINITGESITGSRMVQVFVQGRALDPKVRLTSSPPLPEGEIASLLATGVTTSDLTSSRDEAAGRAAFVLLKQTYRKLFRKSAVDASDDEPPRLSFEFSVFGSDPSRRGVSAVYELTPKWRAIGRVGETGTFRGLLHYLIRFR